MVNRVLLRLKDQSLLMFFLLVLEVAYVPVAEYIHRYCSPADHDDSKVGSMTMVMVVASLVMAIL